MLKQDCMSVELSQHCLAQVTGKTTLAGNETREILNLNLWPTNVSSSVLLLIIVKDPCISNLNMDKFATAQETVDRPGCVSAETVTTMYDRLATPVPVWKICCPSLPPDHIKKRYFIAQETGGKKPIQETSKS